MQLFTHIGVFMRHKKHNRTQKRDKGGEEPYSIAVDFVSKYATTPLSSKLENVNRSKEETRIVTD